MGLGAPVAGRFGWGFGVARSDRMLVALCASRTHDTDDTCAFCCFGKFTAKHDARKLGSAKDL